MKIKCEFCDYEWNSKALLKFVSCPNCLKKNKKKEMKDIKEKNNRNQIMSKKCEKCGKTTKKTIFYKTKKICENCWFKLKNSEPRKGNGMLKYYYKWSMGVKK